MVINVNVPSLNGMDDRTKIKHIEKYLYELNDQLRFVLSNLEIDNFSIETADALTVTEEAKVRAEQDLKKEIESVRQKIKKTAQDIDIQMQEIHTELKGNAKYVDSLYGTLEEEYLKITDENALSKTEIYQTVSKLNGEVTTSQNYIKTGLLDEGADGGIYGVEIGDFGEGAEALKLRLVKNKISFIEGDVTVAYISGTEIVISRAKIKEYIWLGGYIIEVYDGISFDWAGDEEDE